MHQISGENSKLHEKAIRELKKLVTKTKGDLKPKLVILYGSTARGDWHKGSDIDILVVSDNMPPNFKDRGDQFLTVIEGFPVEPHMYTTREFEEMLNHGRMTALDALTEGTILYAQKKYLKRVKKELEQTMKKLKPERISIGWRIRGL
jgi:hypothetical protein